MLSLLDVLLQTPFHRILQSLPISAEMKLALAGDQSPASLTLELIRSLESCDWDHAEEIQHRLGLAEGEIALMYTDALHWASTMTGEDAQPQR